MARACLLVQEAASSLPSLVVLESVETGGGAVSGGGGGHAL